MYVDVLCFALCVDVLYVYHYVFALRVCDVRYALLVCIVCEHCVFMTSIA